MTVAYKDLCLDALDPAGVGRFWASVLGGDLEVMDDGDAVVRGAGLGTLWVNGVPEPKTVKNRVHLDLHVADVRDLVARGATVVAEFEALTVLADPEGNELCAFPLADDQPTAHPPGDAPARAFALCVDAADPEPIARWWHDRLGGRLGPGPDGVPRYLHDPSGLEGSILKFVPVDDPRVVKNRWHWDVDGAVEPLVAAGARVLRAADAEIDWTVMADPDGNEFCVFRPDP